MPWGRPQSRMRRCPCRLEWGLWSSMSELFAVAEDGAIIRENGGQTAVPWWSFTKTAIAAAALTLVRDGRLDLDAPAAGKPFTLRQLLQHRAGVAEYGALPQYHRAVADRDTPWSVAELLSRVEADRLRFTPGSNFLYSNVGYLFVRRLMEDIVGAPLAGILRERLFQPLSINDASIAEMPAFCEEVLGARVARGLFHQSSIGGVTGVAPGTRRSRDLIGTVCVAIGSLLWSDR
jgi:CubicO group peptidase (beta-lactamase class C family)